MLSVKAARNNPARQAECFQLVRTSGPPYGQELCCRPIAISQRDAGDGHERAEEAESAGQDVELVAAGVFPFVIKGDVLRMLDEEPVATLQDQHELPKWDGADQSAEFIPDCVGTHESSEFGESDDNS